LKKKIKYENLSKPIKRAKFGNKDTTLLWTLSLGQHLFDILDKMERELMDLMPVVENYALVLRYKGGFTWRYLDMQNRYGVW